MITNTVAFWIRGIIIPKTISKTIGKLCLKFLYFGRSQARHLHLISWANTCKPLSHGGLGIASLQALREAFNCGTILRFYNNHSPSSIWLKNRYTSLWKECSPSATGFWKSICHTAAMFRNKFNFIIAQNSPIAIHWDHWCSGDNITSIYPDLHLSTLCNENNTLADWMFNNDWSLPTSIRHDINFFYSSHSLF